MFSQICSSRLSIGQVGSSGIKRGQRGSRGVQGFQGFSDRLGESLSKRLVARLGDRMIEGWMTGCNKNWMMVGWQD